MREKTVKRELECILTDSELKDYSKILATSVREKTKLEADLKSYSSHKKAEIETHNGTIALMSEKVASGKEYRDVVCDVTYRWDLKIKTYTRRDTGDVFGNDIISDRELQEEAELNAPKPEPKPTLEDKVDSLIEKVSGLVEEENNETDSDQPA
jgi:hypothetical protein